MGRPVLVILVALGLAVPAARPLCAQTPVDPSGHWVGSVIAPGQEMGFEIDFTKNAAGEFSGTISVPVQSLKGLPLSKVTLKDHAINFWARDDQLFGGTLSDDGKSISGDFAISGFAVPFHLARTGDAKIDPPPTSPAVSKDLEGTWNARVAPDGGGASVRAVLTIANQANGTAVVRLVNLDEGGVQIPMTIEQKGANVTLKATVLQSSFDGTLSADRNELVGTWKQGPAEMAVTFRREAK